MVRRGMIFMLQTSTSCAQSCKLHLYLLPLSLEDYVRLTVCLSI